MIPPRITAKAVAFLASRDERHRRGLTAQETQLFDLEVDRLKNRQWARTGRQKSAAELRDEFWRDQDKVPQ